MAKVHGPELGAGGGGGAGGPSGAGQPAPPVVLRPRPDLAGPALALSLALVLHALAGVGMYFYTRYKLVHPEKQRAQQPLEIAVVDKPAPPPLKAAEPPPPKPVPMKRVARAPVKPPPVNAPPPTARPPPPPTNDPPPPTVEAKGPPSKEPVRVLSGITLESTSQGGTFAAPVGNTLYGAPGKIAADPKTVKPYKADRYAPAAQVNELPHVLSQPEIRRFYPSDALKSEFEGDVVLRLLIDSDGSIAKVDVVNDPGRGLGAAAVQAIREFRFAPGKVNGTAVATTVPFVIHFVIN